MSAEWARAMRLTDNLDSISPGPKRLLALMDPERYKDDPPVPPKDEDRQAELDKYGQFPMFPTGTLVDRMLMLNFGLQFIPRSFPPGGKCSARDLGRNRIDPDTLRLLQYKCQSECRLRPVPCFSEPLAKPVALVFDLRDDGKRVPVRILLRS